MQTGTDGTPGTLSVGPVRLIPRDREQEEITRLLRDAQVRLVNLVGPPGAGKTCLATQTAAVLDADFADGVIFVDLSPLQDPEDVPSAIGAALGLREATDRRVGDRVKMVLRERQMLLLLDTFEHVLPAAPMVADVLAACPHLKVLATSREALHLKIEQCYPVGPLALPSTMDETLPRVLEQVPSIALFCLRARAVRGNWTLDEANGRAVAELCRRLDGLPLGIELAAAWSGMLSPRAVLARLEYCLNAGLVHAADRPDRHRTLRAAISWSYDLLGAEEQALFDRLAVFSGGWDQQAAAAIAGTTTEAVLPLLAALANKHLIVSIEQPTDGEPRFGLLDTLHAFAQARLKASVAENATRRRHAQHYVTLAEQAERTLIGPDQRTWLDRLERELGNLRNALRWAIDSGEVELALRLAGALWFFWDMRGHLREGQQWLEAALALPGAADTGSRRLAALNAAGWLALVHHGSYGPAVTLLEEARSMAEEAGDRDGLVRAKAFLGLTLAIGTQEIDRAQDLLASAVAGGAAIGDAWALALALYGQGHLALRGGRAEQAQERWQTCAAVAHSVGNLYGLSYLQFRWGVLALANRDLQRATGCLKESLRLAGELDSTREMAVAIAALALVAGAAGQVERAARLAGATQALLNRAGCDLPVFLRDEYERGVAVVREHLDAGRFARLFETGNALPAWKITQDALGAMVTADGNTEDPAPRAEPEYTPLTAREWEVACLVAQGLRNREISERLILAERTIGSHLERMYAKLRIRSRAQLVVWVAERKPPAPSSELLMAGAAPVEQFTREAASRPARRLRLVGNSWEHD